MTASAAWRPWSRLTPPARASACSIDSTVMRNFYTVHVNAPQAPEATLPAIQGADQVPSGTLPNSKASAAPSASPSASSTKK